MPDYRSAEAAEYRRLYRTAAWCSARATQLALQPLCERCLKAGTVTAANVVNHRQPHRGDWALFIDPSNHESTCKPHHDSTIQREEKAGFSGQVDADGWPVDPRHRANRQRRP